MVTFERDIDKKAIAKNTALLVTNRMQRRRYFGFALPSRPGLGLLSANEKLKKVLAQATFCNVRIAHIANTLY